MNSAVMLIVPSLRPVIVDVIFMVPLVIKFAMFNSDFPIQFQLLSQISKSTKSSPVLLNMTLSSISANPFELISAAIYAELSPSLILTFSLVPSKIPYSLILSGLRITNPGT